MALGLGLGLGLGSRLTLGHGFLMIFVEATVSVKFIFMKGCLDKSR